jgi:hypothetical protein
MGKITNLMSTDTTRIDFICGYFHIIWAAPVEILIGLGLLIRNLGVSGLAGFAIMVRKAVTRVSVMYQYLPLYHPSDYYGTASNQSYANAVQVTAESCVGYG